VFADVPYSRLNEIKICDVKMDSSHAVIMADLTAAYEPEIGVRKFTRVFEFSAPGRFVVKDSVELERPQIVTSYFHSDNLIEKRPGSIFAFEPGGTSLSVQIAKSEMFNSLIEKNILTAPGKPGSVDKGEREERGVRLAVSTKEKVKKLEQAVTLEIVKKK
ncbi:MAG: hypothetical protein ABIV48_02165, partial [Pyrinomonadaceae bacterium]